MSTSLKDLVLDFYSGKCQHCVYFSCTLGNEVMAVTKAAFYFACIILLK